MDLACNCKSDERTVALVAKNITERYPELTEFGSQNDWRLEPELDIFMVNVGYTQKFQGRADLTNFLRSILDDTRFNQLRSCWLNRDQPVSDQTSKLIHAEPLGELVGADSSQLSEILRNRRIETWFQPVISATDGTIWGYECLMRSRSKSGATLHPTQLLEWARQEKLTFMLDRICRETHLQNAGRLNPPPNLQFLINFLPTAIYQPEYCLQTSLAAAERSGLKPSQIIFEVVESEKAADHAHLKRIIEYYRSAGFRVALDETGSGHGDLHPDLVKIDRELVVKSVDSQFHKGICAAVINLSKEHGHTVLAEGVETAEERAIMEELGVDLFQGFFFGRPAPITAPFEDALTAA